MPRSSATPCGRHALPGAQPAGSVRPSEEGQADEKKAGQPARDASTRSTGRFPRPCGN